jgi:hypothetical protein
MPAAPPSRSRLLNASLEPLCVVTMHRAVLLVLTGKATVLEADDRLLHSERSAVPAPLVLCLTRYVHVPMRRTVPPTRRTADTVDHVHPRSRGGRHEWTNVVAACGRCNNRKSNHLLAELGWELAFTPKAPRGAAALLSAAVRTDPSWTAYLGRDAAA